MYIIDVIAKGGRKREKWKCDFLEVRGNIITLLQPSLYNFFTKKFEEQPFSVLSIPINFVEKVMYFDKEIQEVDFVESE